MPTVNCSYAYILNYPTYERELCELEIFRLFKQTPTDKYVFSDTDLPIDSSAFVKYKLKVLHCQPTFAELLKNISTSDYVYQDFKMLYLKHSENDVEYQNSLDKIRAVCEYIDGSANVQAPVINLGITKIKDLWYFGEVELDNQSWQKHRNKPHSYSMSLSVRFAKAIVNIAAESDQQKRLVDPCCGVGTTLLEAQQMGYNIVGYEINREVARKANMNLQHYGYDLQVQFQDMHNIAERYDTAILDIPYGVYNPVDSGEQYQLICKCHDLADELVLVAFEDMSKMLNEAGFVIERIAIVTKAQFKRYVYLARRKIDKNANYQLV